MVRDRFSSDPPVIFAVASQKILPGISMGASKSTLSQADGNICPEKVTLYKQSKLSHKSVRGTAQYGRDRGKICRATKE